MFPKIGIRVVQKPSIPDNLATFRQKWTLDQMGNWDEFDQDDGDGTTWDLEQKRYHNDANEIDVNIGSDDISLQPGGNGTNWANAGYDEAGNMSSFPKPRHLDQRYSPIYDAWNRMTVVFGSGLAIRQKNEYDGLHRRIERHEDTDGDGWLDANDDHRHYYYNDRWQCLAETIESGGAETLDALNAYHPQYIDAVSTRIRSSDGYHFLHDANFNVVAAIDFDVLSKPVVERYHYSPYGEVTVLNGTSDTDGTAWTADPDNKSDIDNEFLYTGRRLDPETGLQYSRWRYLHVQLGRFLTRDPIEYEGGDANLYGYVWSNPVAEVDPMGLEPTYSSKGTTYSSKGPPSSAHKRKKQSTGSKKRTKGKHEKGQKRAKPHKARQKPGWFQRRGPGFGAGASAVAGAAGAWWAMAGSANAAEIDPLPGLDEECTCVCVTTLQRRDAPGWGNWGQGGYWEPVGEVGEPYVAGTMSAGDCVAMEDTPPTPIGGVGGSQYRHVTDCWTEDCEDDECGEN